VIAANFWWLLKARSNAYYHWRHGTEPTGGSEPYTGNK